MSDYNYYQDSSDDSESAWEYLNDSDYTPAPSSEYTDWYTSEKTGDHEEYNNITSSSEETPSYDYTW